MSFISIEYIIFFITILLLYFILPQNRRWILLLIASYIFYSFSRVIYVLIIAFSTVIDYFVAKQIDRIPSDRKLSRQSLLFLSITANLGVLFIFKYFNFFSQNFYALNPLMNTSDGLLQHSLMLPVGISFYTFQSMAYTIDVYRGNISVEKNLGIFATYVAFFPQLVAGPIERAGNLLPQFRQKYILEYSRIVTGLRLILWGVFKKVVIADQLSIYVNATYNQVESYTGLPFIVATLFFTFQIYCDFSGYSDIAIGSAKILGFDLMDNFRQPYFSRSVREFWQRWHISLSTWFRDYLYIPLGGNRVSFIRNLLNLMIVFIISGLWHGANWTFIIWGTLHGIYIVVETIYSKVQDSMQNKMPHIPGILQQVIVFIIISFTWIFFRANTPRESLYIVTNIFNPIEGKNNIFSPLNAQSINSRSLAMMFGLIIILLIIEWFQQHSERIESLTNNAILRWILYYLATFLILITIASSPTNQQFIYFQF